MDISGSKILVTGGAGFIGSHLVEALLAKGAKVVAMDNLFTGSKDNLSQVMGHENFVFVEGDVNDNEVLKKVFIEHKPEYIFHYAAILGVKRVMEEPLLVLKDIDGFQALMEFAKAYGVKKVVFASSSEAYGDSRDLPLVEDSANLVHHSPQSQNLYAMVKLMGEKIMNIYDDMYGVPTCSLRFFNVFGPRQESSAYGFVTGVFIKQALQGNNLTVFGDGYQTRDFIYVKDNVEMGIKALLSLETNGEVINIGIGRQTTIQDLAERIVKISGKNITIEHLPPRPYEIVYRAPDVTKMKKLLGSIEDKLDENLKETYEWYANKS